MRHAIESLDAAAPVVLLAYLLLAVVSAALVKIDFDTLRLPNAIVLPSAAVFALMLTVAVVAGAESDRLATACAAAAALGFGYGLLWWLRPSGIGAGDVKLAALLGLALGWAGWQAVLVGTLIAWVLGGALGLALLASHHSARQANLPFGPPMIAGAWFAIALG